MVGKWLVFGALCFVPMGFANADPDTATRISQFSGKPVPRFESLKFAAANGRTGPSRDHKIEWRYERQGLPMLILKESNDWRRVRDPAGDEVWMHRRMLSGKMTAMTRRAVKVHETDSETAPEIATLAGSVVVDLKACNAVWCHVEVEGRYGWTKRLDLWGADPVEAGL